MRNKIFVFALSLVFIASFAGVAGAAANRAELYLDGDVVGTIANPGHVAPGSGTDPLYQVANGVDDQLGIAGVGPGDDGYHGGRWAVYKVAFVGTSTPVLLTSEEAVMMAEKDGLVTVKRAPELDNRCPIQR